MKQAEVREKQYLSEIQDKLQQTIDTIDMRLKQYHEEIEVQKIYLAESRDEMDHVEKIDARRTIEQAVFTGDKALDLKKRLQRLVKSPYFGRFDFRAQDQKMPHPVYIGIHQFFDDDDNKTLIHDWRAPIAAMFYDHETGAASYHAPEGEKQGEISLKRQFRIRDGQLEFMLESAVNIMDDVLQEALSEASDDGMKNIVATIQRDQNAIIRNEHAQNLIIQGVAGSGKTSIALHRIAFLLYRFKDTLKSEDILIISPNSVFADYISNVLPELGEESVQEIQMETLAESLLDGQYRFQTFFEQIAALLDERDPDLEKRIQAKSTTTFLDKLNQYADYVEKNTFVEQDIWIEGRLIPGWYLAETFEKHRGYALTERINRTAKSTEQRVGIEYNFNFRPEHRKQLKTDIRKMYQRSTLRETYKQMFDWLGQPEWFKPAKRSLLEYADVFPLIYLKMRLEGKSRLRWPTKHLLIDEMQDYTPVQYAVIEKIFSCKKTILGDANQSVNPHSASDASSIRKTFIQASLVKLNKSYRSTYEITQFAQQIVPDPELEAMQRYGETPQILQFQNKSAEKNYLLERVKQFENSHYNSMAIICKTQQQAAKIADYLQKHNIAVQLLTAQTATFAKGIIVSTAYMAKGLEFDEVIVPELSQANYHSAMHRHLLYVACTRAMHRLTVTYTDTRSDLLPESI
ncbi:MAG: 3'-5' exonuclease [Methylophaga sp.]|nr:3'-5' exonuclease [Methylophaga sp.]